MSATGWLWIAAAVLFLLLLVCLLAGMDRGGRL